jgi:hypothetical protein
VSSVRGRTEPSQARKSRRVRRIIRYHGLSWRTGAVVGHGRAERDRGRRRVRYELRRAYTRRRGERGQGITIRAPVNFGRIRPLFRADAVRFMAQNVAVSGRASLTTSPLLVLSSLARPEREYWIEQAPVRGRKGT